MQNLMGCIIWLPDIVPYNPQLCGMPYFACQILPPLKDQRGGALFGRDAKYGVTPVMTLLSLLETKWGIPSIWEGGIPESY